MAVATKIVLLHRTLAGNQGFPTSGFSLLPGEPAWHEKDQTLVIGKGQGGFDYIGGSGAFASLSVAQNISAAHSFTGNATAVTRLTGDNTTKLATCQFVQVAVAGATGQTQTVNLTGGDVTGLGSTGATGFPANITAGAVTFSKMQDVPNGTLLYRRTTQSGSGPVDNVTLTTFKSELNVTTGDVFGLQSFINATPISDLTAASANLSLGGNVIENVGSPTAPHHAANKGYVDNAIEGLDYKEAVKVVCHANPALTLSGTRSGANTGSAGSVWDTDGIAVDIGDRVLVTNQLSTSDKVNHGIWVVQSGAWTRPDDYNTGDTVDGGVYVFVQEGATYPDTSWVISGDGNKVIDTDATTWTQFSGSAMPGGTPLKTYYGGTGIGSGTVGSGPSNGSILFGNRANTDQAMSQLTIGSAGYVMVSDGSEPTWSGNLASSSLTIYGGTF